MGHESTSGPVCVRLAPTPMCNAIRRALALPLQLMQAECQAMALRCYMPPPALHALCTMVYTWSAVAAAITTLVLHWPTNLPCSLTAE